MLRFNIGRIPVEVHFSHLLISGLIAWSFAQSPGSPNTWPGRILVDASHPQHGATLLICVVLWMAMVSGSVLVHELGHAFAARAMGYQPAVYLVGLGGLTRAPGAERMEWHKDVLFTLAGPASGLALGILAGVGSLALRAGGVSAPGVTYVFDGLFFANLVWTVLNLVPVATLDGGRVASAVLTRIMGRPGFLAAQIVSLGVAGLLIVWALARQDYLLTMLVLLLGFRTFANIGAYRRGELPLGEAAHPSQAVLERAELLYREGKLAEAELVARDVVAANAPKSITARAHYLLGWISLKEGNGGNALKHFSQLEGVEVPPHALAAAYSLVGDEARAIPLWARAAQLHQDDVILHEFAGALIRAGREAEARRLPGVRPALAYTAAERVHFVRGEFALAAQAAEQAFREELNPTFAYDSACAWARAGDGASAMRMLTLAAQNGFRDASAAETDPDLAALRGTPQFEGWLSTLRKNAAS